MGFIDYDSILPVIRFVKSAFESRAVFDVLNVSYSYFVMHVCTVFDYICMFDNVNKTELL